MSDIEELNKNIETQKLLDAYADLLTEKQREVMDLYYFSDLSLREIAQNKGISYQAVRDSIIKSIKIMNTYEEKLHIINDRSKIESVIEMLKTEEGTVIKKAIKILESL